MSTKEVPTKTYEDTLGEVVNRLADNQKRYGEFVTKREEVAARPDQPFVCEFNFLKKNSQGCLGTGPLIKENGWVNYLVTKAEVHSDKIRRTGCHHCVEALRKKVGGSQGREIPREKFSTLATDYWRGRLDWIDKEIEMTKRKIAGLEVQEKELKEKITARDLHRAHQQEVLSLFGITIEENGDSEEGKSSAATKTRGSDLRVSIGDELRSKSKEGRVIH